MPLPKTLRRALCALAILAALAAPAFGAVDATSRPCLEQCITQCRDAPGGEGDRAVCLGSCLEGCAVACGTVDASCARVYLNKASAQAWKDAPNLAAACAGACVTSVDCLPKPLVKRPAGPGILSGSARAKVLRQARQKGSDESFTAQDRSFSLSVPWDWDLAEDAGLGPDGTYEITATAPNADMLRYVQVSARHVPAPGATAEGFLRELADSRPGAQGVALGTARLDGREARSVEFRTTRTMTGFPDQVPSWVRALALPLAGGGYVALVADVPLALKDRYAAQIERLFQSFRLLAPAQAAALPATDQGLTAEEYAVYAAFFASRGITEKGRGGLPGSMEAQPPYLEDAARARSVLGETETGPELGQKALETLRKVCGGVDGSLAQDYGRKRAQRVAVADRIPAEGVKVRAAKAAASASAAPEMMPRKRPPTGEEMLYGPSLGFSRVGFDAAGTTALFHVSNLGSNPGTSYLVIMVKRDGRWVLSCALLDQMRIY